MLKKWMQRNTDAKNRPTRAIFGLALSAMICAHHLEPEERIVFALQSPKNSTEFAFTNIALLYRTDATARDHVHRLEYATKMLDDLTIIEPSNDEVGVLAFRMGESDIEIRFLRRRRDELKQVVRYYKLLQYLRDVQRQIQATRSPVPRDYITLWQQSMQELEMIPPEDERCDVMGYPVHWKPYPVRRALGPY